MAFWIRSYLRTQGSQQHIAPGEQNELQQGQPGHHKAAEGVTGTRGSPTGEQRPPGASAGAEWGAVAVGDAAAGPGEAL